MISSETIKSWNSCNKLEQEAEVSTIFPQQNKTTPKSERDISSLFITMFYAFKITKTKTISLKVPQHVNTVYNIPRISVFGFTFSFPAKCCPVALWCHLACTALLRSAHWFSIMFRSGYCIGQGQTFSLGFLRFSIMNFDIWFRSFSISLFHKLLSEILFLFTCRFDNFMLLRKNSPHYKLV